ncbi:dihydroneopterin aldolase [Neoehrlichia mikurensis]|uniref:Dihydroneopterin aldolase n=1 Tax=Neoehrlichia mikurensis TaxID=89586 RepID=A0A9Q9BZ31_9RICK|nr:dihydroneopterin aldolase [Neoehrlichia mikurensis]QXK91962.1 dihydroneopterin aldolase [Neoehrlichia mikurensis]QXK93176.1 dihydroneopterin aldolase [Neoehrlichia mikurensis]QXK93654.1 dihydroneopterin aldolase [Neoehrlichia mikurensis]UTO55389.1 dihydroneopterin aldolase [Neoehrlichia mikurensis]UTO56308.1 dihydroneopterin aldolase [Neoehrlichia mikurensis]
MANIMHIRNFIIYARIGVYAWEKVIKQKVIIDIKLPINNINFIDYKALIDEITNFINVKHYDFLEDMIQCLKDFLKKKFNVITCCIKIHKPLLVSNLGAKVYVLSTIK